MFGVILCWYMGWGECELVPLNLKMRLKKMHLGNLTFKTFI